MPHDTPLITTIVAGLGLAFVFAGIASRFRIPPIVGYLLAGVVAGPFTPGFVADQALANELAELGIILLMFGVGLHFSLKDLMSVRAIALPGAVAQIAAATILGLALALAAGWSVGGGIVFGLALSVASTVVLLRAMQERRLIETERGRIAVGWLIVEDLAMVLTLVLLPAVSGLLGGASGGTTAQIFGFRFEGLSISGLVGVTLLKVTLFVGLMLVVGRRLIPWVLHHVAHMGSRELFRLAVLATALAVAYGAAHLFDVSLALGAFFAGMVMSESPLSQRAAQETLPLRDAFAVLFFVSVGMLFNPATLVNSPWLVLATLAIILAGKSAAAYLIVRAFGHSNTTALTISASLAQIGEFSFILGELGVRLDLLPGEGRDLILAGAIISILLNPVIFAAVDRLARRAAATAAPDAPPAPPEPDAIEPTKLSNHTILIGYGRVGRLVADALAAKARPFLVVEAGDQAIAGSRERKFETIVGNAATPEILAATNPAGASHLVVAIPEPFEAGQVVEQARKANPALNILARAHSDAEVEHLRSLGANTVIMGEREIARGMIEELDSLAGAGTPSAA
jgi:CPA2 family monovalent cation:H+ antiporter-2